MSAPSTASFGASSHGAALTAAGSTFVAPFFAVAFAKYHQQHPAVGIMLQQITGSDGTHLLS